VARGPVGTCNSWPEITVAIFSAPIGGLSQSSPPIGGAGGGLKQARIVNPCQRRKGTKRNAGGDSSGGKSLWDYNCRVRVPLGARDPEP